MSQRVNYVSGGEDGPKFICCVNRRHPQIHEVWTFGEDGVTHEVHFTARLDILLLYLLVNLLLITLIQVGAGSPCSEKNRVSWRY